MLLERKGRKTSASTVGRILVRLKVLGLLRETPRRLLCLRRRTFRWSYAARKGKDHAIGGPGDLVQVDTLDVRPLPGVAFKHHPTRDVVSRWDGVQGYGRATATPSWPSTFALGRCVLPGRPPPPFWRA